MSDTILLITWQGVTDDQLTEWLHIHIGKLSLSKRLAAFTPHTKVINHKLTAINQLQLSLQ